MRNILTIAGMTLREGQRDKLFISILGLAALFLAFAWYLSLLAFGDMGKILLDIGQSGILIAGMIIIVFFVTGSLYKERERMLHALLMRCTRAEYLVGKWLGFAMLMAAFVTISGAALAMAASTYGQNSWALVQSLLYTFLELSLIAAFCMLFSTFVSSQALNGLFTFGIYIGGHALNEAMRIAVLKSDESLQLVSHLLIWVLPDLERLNIRILASYKESIPLGEFLLTLGYGTTWIMAALLLSTIVFRRQAL